MQYTKNLKLNLPERSDQFNLDHWNENTNNLDKLVYQNQLDVSQNKNDISKIFNGLDTKNVSDTNSVYYKLMKLIYPVGCLYWSSNNINPSQLFGGTWAQIKDKFILSAGDTYNNNDVGGSSTVILTVEQIPSHTHTGSSHWHSYTPAGSVKVTTNPTFTGSSHSHSYTPTGSVKVTTNPTFTGSAVTSSNGGAHTHYLAGYNNTKSGNKWYDSSEASAQRLAIYGNFDTIINTEKASSTNTDISRRIWWTPNYGGTGVGTYDVRTDTSLTHTHSVTASGSISGGVYAFTGTSTSLSATQGGSISGGAYSFTGVEGATNLAGTGATGSTGGGTSHDNMPPYIVKYCWERTK